MQWENLLAPEGLPEYLAALAMLALAAWLLRLNVRNATNAAFAGFLAARALNMFLATFLKLAERAGDVPDALVWERVRPLALIAQVITLIAFVALFPRPRRWLQTFGFVPLVVLAGIVCQVLVVARPGLWETDAIVTQSGQTFLLVESIGPLYAFQFVADLTIAAAALLFALEHARMATGPLRDSLLLVTVAFLLHSVYDASNALLLLFNLSWASTPRPTYILVAMNASALLVDAAAVFLLSRHGLRDPDVNVRRSVRNSLRFVPLPILTNLLVFLLVVWGVEPVGNGPTRLFFLGAWRFSMPLLVTYALMKHQLFDIDLRAQRTIKRSAIAVVFVGVFFVVGDAAENILQGKIGTYLGILAALLLSLTLDPLQRLAERIATSAVPGGSAGASLGPVEALAFYREQARIAWSDGTLSAKERRLLDASRMRLGLDASEADRVEQEVRPSHGNALGNS